MEVSKQYEALSLEQFKQIMEKLSRLDNQMQEHFGPNQRTFNVAHDFFVYFSLVPFCVGNIFFSLVIQISCILETSLRFSIAFISIQELSL